MQERHIVRDKLRAIHEPGYQTFLREHSRQFFRPGNMVLVRNRVESPPAYPKLDGLWQDGADMLQRLSESTYRVNYNGLEGVLTVERLKPFVPYRECNRAPLHSSSEQEGLVETENYVVDKVIRLETPGSAANHKLWWYVKYRRYPQPKWQLAASVLHDIKEEWLK